MPNGDANENSRKKCYLPKKTTTTTTTRLGFVFVFFVQKSWWPCNLPPKRAGAWNVKFHPGVHLKDLRINIKKTETMNVGEQINFYIDGHKLKRVDRFKYPGSYVTKDCNGDAEITARIQCVIPLMIYGSETLTLYNHHIKPLRTVHQRHLRSIPNIRWDHFITIGGSC